MLISLKQCQILLSADKIEKILDLAKQYNCSDISLHAPQFNDQEKKINFYVKDQDDMDYYTASRLTNSLKSIIQYEDITLSVDSLIDPDFKPFIQENIIPLTRSNLEKLRDSLEDFDIKTQEATDGETYVTIMFGPSVSREKIQELVKYYYDTTKEKIHAKSDERQFQHKPTLSI